MKLTTHVLAALCLPAWQTTSSRPARASRSHHRPIKARSNTDEAGFMSHGSQ